MEIYFVLNHSIVKTHTSTFPSHLEENRQLKTDIQSQKLTNSQLKRKHSIKCILLPKHQ